MKHQLKQIFAYTLFGLSIIACDPKTKEATTNETTVEKTKYEWVDLDLSKQKVKYPITIKAPKGFKLDESTDVLISIHLESSNLNYNVNVIEPEFYEKGAEGFVNIMKTDIKTSVAFKFEKFIIDTPDSYIAKTSNGYTSFRLMKAGDKFYSCVQMSAYAFENESDARELYQMMGMLKLN
jgi:hypothetical protein